MVIEKGPVLVVLEKGPALIHQDLEKGPAPLVLEKGPDPLSLVHEPAIKLSLSRRKRLPPKKKNKSLLTVVKVSLFLEEENCQLKKARML